MKIVIFGLTVSSSWGNGHATLWRALIKSLARRGHEVTFFEKDMPYYSCERDLWELTSANLILYSDWADIEEESEREIAAADVALVTSYCPDALIATESILNSKAGLKVFYDMDTPITLDALGEGKDVPYLGPYGLQGFDLIFSYTGGAALEKLKTDLRAQRVAPLYGSVNPDEHHRVASLEQYACDLSYLGTFAEDRQHIVNALLIEPARRLPERKFLIGGAKYPEDYPWTSNIFFARHVAPSEHPAFYSSSTLTLNATRRAMAEMGYCPSGRLFEAAACGTPILSDYWEGIEQFFTPQREILIARNSEEAVEAIKLPVEDLQEIAENARARTLDEHTADHRAQDFEREVENALNRVRGNEMVAAG